MALKTRLMKLRLCATKIVDKRTHETCRLVILLVIVITVAGSSLASTMERRSSSSTFFQQRPVFGATVSQVQVDAIVTNRSGEFVDNLTQADFTVYEDNEPQQILDIQLIDLVAGTIVDLGDSEDTSQTFDSTNATDSSDEVTKTPDNIAAVDSATNYGALVFLIDGPSLDLKTKSRFLVAWEKLLKTTEGLRIPRAVYLANNFGTLEELVPLTLETDPLFEAIEAVRKTPTPGNSMKSNFYELLDDMNFPQGIDAARAKARAFEYEETQRSMASLALLTQFCDALSSRSGRTALIWVTTGIKITVGGPYTILTGEDPASPAAVWERQQQLFDPYTPDSQITARQRQLHEAANSANVSIYTVDPTLRGDLRSMDVDVSTRSAGDARRLSSMEFQSSLDSLRDSLKDAATATGGESFVYWTDLGAALATIEKDSSRFYLLTYAAPSPEGDGQYHNIRVEVNRPDLTVRERRGYIDLPLDERRSREIIGALTLPGAVTGPPVFARAFHRWSSDGESIVQLAIAIDSTTDKTTSNATTDNTLLVEPSSLVFHAAAIADNGRTVDEVHQGVRSLFGPADSGNLAAIWPFRYVYDWTLPSGTYALRVVIEDEVTGELSATQIKVEVPNINDEWHASDLILATTNGSAPPLPLVVDEATEDTQLIVYVEVAGGDEPVLSGSVFSADGIALLAPLPPVSLQKQAGIHRGALRLKGMPPGEIILQAAITDVVPGRSKIFRRTLKISGTIPQL